MPAIGITGGVATGKSTFCDCLREILPAAKFFDADRAAHELVDLPEVREELIREFGEKILSGTGDLNRDKLRAIVFRDAAKKRALEEILHPRIRRQWSALAETHRNNIQLERLLRKKSIGQREAEEMINSQMPLEEKIRRADHGVWNNGGRSVLMEQARNLVALWQL